MISIGVDAHKQVHAAVAIDDAGRELGQWRGPNSKSGWLRLAAWSEEFGPARRWGIEGAWSYGRGLAQTSRLHQRDGLRDQQPLDRVRETTRQETG